MEGVGRCAALAGLKISPQDIQKVTEMVVAEAHKNQAANSSVRAAVKVEKPPSPRNYGGGHEGTPKATIPPPSPAPSTVPADLQPVAATTMNGMQHMTSPAPFVREPDQEAPQQLVEKLAATERENQALLIRLRQLEAFSKPAEPVKDPRLEGLLEKISELEGRLRKKHPKGKPDEPEGDDSEGSSECDDESQGITTPSGQTVNISTDALRMRRRRICEQKPSGKYTIDKETSMAYKEGGSAREVLEMALLECLAKHGTARSARNKIKADFTTKCRLIRERMESRETEQLGKWMTEESMKKSNKFTALSIKKIMNYCRKFPDTMIRGWQYDEDVEEFFVVTDDNTSVKKTDSTKTLEETDLQDKVSATAPVPKEIAVNVPDFPKASTVGSQPVMDLQTYMEALNKKNVAVSKMVGTLGSHSDTMATTLKPQLEKLNTSMGESYKKFASYITELRMDHQDGKVQSDELNKLMASVDAEKQCVKRMCAEMLSLDADFRQWQKDGKSKPEKPVKPVKPKAKGKAKAKAKSRARNNGNKDRKGDNGTKSKAPRKREAAPVPEAPAGPGAEQVPKKPKRKHPKGQA